MPIDERLRAGLQTALEDLRLDVDTDLTRLRLRAQRRSRVRAGAYAAGLVAAAIVAAVTLGLGGDDSQRSVDPVGPGGGVRVLDAYRGSPASPAPLDPGHYAIPFIGAAEDAPWGRVDVPPGWAQDRLLLATGPDLDPHLRRIELLAITMVARDPCGGALKPVRATVPDIVKALTEQRTVRPSAARPASIDGHSGQVVRFRVPSGPAVEKCSGGQSLKPFGLSNSYASVFPGWTYRVWVLDVEGHPLVIMAAHGPRTSPTELAELTATVEGIRFVPSR